MVVARLRKAIRGGGRAGRRTGCGVWMPVIFSCRRLAVAQTSAAARTGTGGGSIFPAGLHGERPGIDRAVGVADLRVGGNGIEIGEAGQNGPPFRRWEARPLCDGGYVCVGPTIGVHRRVADCMDHVRAPSIQGRRPCRPGRLASRAACSFAATVITQEAAPNRPMTGDSEGVESATPRTRIFTDGGMARPRCARTPVAVRAARQVARTRVGDSALTRGPLLPREPVAAGAGATRMPKGRCGWGASSGLAYSRSRPDNRGATDVAGRCGRRGAPKRGTGARTTRGWRNQDHGA